VTVCRTQTKPRSDVVGRGEMVGEIPRCPTLEETMNVEMNGEIHQHAEDVT